MGEADITLSAVGGGVLAEVSEELPAAAHGIVGRIIDHAPDAVLITLFAVLIHLGRDEQLAPVFAALGVAHGGQLPPGDETDDAPAVELFQNLIHGIGLQT